MNSFRKWNLYSAAEFLLVLAFFSFKRLRVDPRKCFPIDFFSPLFPPSRLYGDFAEQDNMQIEQIHALHIDECGISCFIAGFPDENGNDIRVRRRASTRAIPTVMSWSVWKITQLGSSKLRHKALIVGDVVQFAVRIKVHETSRNVGKKRRR